ncbi:DUF1592 domain-containing protein [Vibrio paucivorans]
MKLNKMYLSVVGALMITAPAHASPPMWVEKAYNLDAEVCHIGTHFRAKWWAGPNDVPDPEGPTTHSDPEWSKSAWLKIHGSSACSSTVTNSPPSIVLGPDRQVKSPDLNVILDGSGTYDMEQDSLSYAWEQISGPIVVMVNANKAVAHFIMPELTERVDYEFRLTVSDGENESSDTLRVTGLVSSELTVISEITGSTPEDSQAILATITADSKEYYVTSTYSEPPKDYNWQHVLAQNINDANVPGILAGELKMDGTIEIVKGSSYRNKIWGPAGAVAELELVPDFELITDISGTVPSSSQAVLTTITDVEGNVHRVTSTYDYVPKDYNWQHVVANDINSANILGVIAGELSGSGAISVVKGSSYRNKVWGSKGTTINFELIPRDVEPNNDAPDVTIIFPSDNAKAIAGDRITLKALASDKEGEISSVEFFSNEESIAVVTEPPFHASYLVNSGTHSLTALATDSEGLTTLSDAISIEVSNLESGDGGASDCDYPQYVNEHGYITGDMVVNNGEIYQCKQVGWCGQAPYEPGVPYHGEDYWQDAWSYKGKCEVPENQPPSVEVNLTEVIDSQEFELSALVSDVDGTVERLDYYVDGILYGSTVGQPFTLSHTGLPKGFYRVFAVATDDTGAQARSEDVTLVVKEAFKGNRLTIEFPSFEHKDLLNPPAELENQTLTGTLYCPTDGTSIEFSGTWEDVIHIDELNECQYQLNIDGFAGYVARFSPWVVDFTEVEEPQIKVDALFRAPIDTDSLLPLGGVKVETFLEGIYQPRAMAQGENIIFVGSSAIKLDSDPLGGTIYAVELDPQTKAPIGTYIVAEGEEPHGVAYRDGTLYFSTVGALYKIENINDNFKSRPKAEKIFTYPADGAKTPIPMEQWWTRFQHQKHPLKFNPIDPTDKKLYTAVGLPCNICTTPEEEMYGTIFSIDLETGEYEILANGIRNAVGFDWHPQTGEIWFSDNNRQQFANPDEINRLANPGNENFGAPIFFGKGTRGLTDEEMANWEDMLLGANGGTPIIPPKAILPTIDYDVVKPTDFTGAAFDVMTNSAPLGVKFWNAYSQSENVQHLIYATHGNSRPEHPGLELRMVTIENGTEVIHERPLVTGWMRDLSSVESYTCLTDACVGRPVEFLELADGSMLVSDDKANVLYRVSYDPMGANVKQVSFTTTSSPDESISDELVVGVLTHPNGHESRFHVAWDAPTMHIDGLENGTYQVRLHDVGDYIPAQRNHEITISDSNPSSVIELEYVEKPQDLEGLVKFTAPQKPSGISEQSLTLTIVDQTTSDSIQVDMDWGEAFEQSFGYGSYEIRYPHMKNYYPQPAKQVVEINESNLEHNLYVNYVGFGSGEDLISQNCVSCHSTEFFDDANKANTWNNAGYEALLNKIMSMPIAGHCDRTCAEQIADYLFDDLWYEYLNSTESYGDRQVRLLTSYEYANSIKDLFGITINKEKLPKDKYEREFKYAGQSNQGVILTEDMRQFHAMAVEVSERIDLTTIGYTNSVSTPQFVQDLGLKVYRRPLTSDEHTRFMSFLNQYGPRDLVASMLLSPNYLYRSELGTLTDEAGVYELDQYEVATALSYSFLGTTPSTLLLGKAAGGELATNEQIASEVASMLQSPQGIARFTDFIGYYVHTQVQQLPEKPGLTTDVVNAMVQEQAEFIRYFLTEGEGTVEELFNPNFTFVNGTLAQHYGIEGVTGEEFQKVVVGNGQRGGLLHHGLTQVVNSDYAATSMVKRGLMIRQNLMCRTIGVPVDVDPDDIELPDSPITTRERWDIINGQDASAGQCWQCHEFMNDTGASMENYSQTGKWRIEEAAYNDPSVMLAIDASGPLVDNSGASVLLDFNNSRDISAHFPTNATVLQCLADSYFRYAMGQEAGANSTAGVQDMTKQLEKSGSISEMLETLATSQMFKFKKEDY